MDRGGGLEGTEEGKGEARIDGGNSGTEMADERRDEKELRKT